MEPVTPASAPPLPPGKRLRPWTPPGTSALVIVLCWALLIFLTERMVRITLPYLAFRDDVDFLLIKQTATGNPLWKFSFYLHVLTSTALPLAGLTQFSSSFLHRHRRLHKILGRTYVGIILLASGPAGLVMSVLANGGWTSRLAFTLLSLLWLWTTWEALVSARRGDIRRHRDFMTRSYALTLSALTLRAWKYALVLAIRPNPMDVYRWVAWLGWVPNLLIAETIIRIGKRAAMRTTRRARGRFQLIDLFRWTRPRGTPRIPPRRLPSQPSGPPSGQE